MDNVKISGLKLSKGKTLVDKSMFTLNSTLFCATRGAVVKLPMIRAKALFGTEEDSFSSLQSRFKSFCPGYGSERRQVLHTVFLSVNSRWILASGRSLNRGLQMQVSSGLLKATHLWTRECSYLELPVERKPPMAKSLWEKKPKGFAIAYSEGRTVMKKEDKAEFVKAVVDAAWEPSDNENYADTELKTGLNISGFGQMVSPRSARLMGISVRELKRKISQRNEKIFFDYLKRRVRLRPFWQKLGPRATHFVSERNEHFFGSILYGNDDNLSSLANDSDEQSETYEEMDEMIYGAESDVSEPTTFWSFKYDYGTGPVRSVTRFVNKKFERSGLCSQCGDFGHNMFGCRNRGSWFPVQHCCH
jgi:hypothetical protein